MRWKCPHCQTTLGVRDESVSDQWSFYRCHECAGYSLIRIPEPKLEYLKIDGNPHSPTSTAKTEGVQPPPAPTQKAQLEAAAPSQEANLQDTNFETHQEPQTSTDSNALTENTETNNSDEPSLPDLKKLFDESPLKRSLDEAKTKPKRKISLKDALKFIPRSEGDSSTSGKLDRAIPVAIGILALITVSSGGYLVIQGTSLFDTKQELALQKKSEPTKKIAKLQKRISQEIHHSRAAPAPGLPKALKEKTQPVPEKVEVRTPKKPKPIQNQAKKQKRLTVQLRGKYANLRSGPSIEHKIVGYARPRVRYLVKDWEGQWFRIVDPKRPTQKKTWIRNDLVRLIKSAKR